MIPMFFFKKQDKNKNETIHIFHVTIKGSTFDLNKLK